jgi:hypothetical protein
VKKLVLFLFLACASVGSLPAEVTEIEIVPADPTVYGEYPKNYQEIVTQWLGTTLVDAPSAKVEWVAPPKPGSLPEKKGGKALFGYLVEIRVNSRNRFGTYTGFQKHSVLIRDGHVIKATGFGF